MSDPLFDSRTPRQYLPLLFAGQAQKELFVNESLARIDALLHCAIMGLATTPPGSPAEGDCWLIGPSPNGAWTGKNGQLALFQSGNWLFQPPFDGLRLLDRSTGQERRFHGVWKVANRPSSPTGGMVIDLEARTALANLFDSLTIAGILPPV
jgi:hypothetical protein